MRNELDLNDLQIVLSRITGTGVNMTHETMNVTFAENMKNGSIVDDQGVLVEASDADSAYGILDDHTMRNLSEGLSVGDALTVAVAVRGCVFNEDNLYFDDGTTVINDTAKAALANKMNSFSAVITAS